MTVTNIMKDETGDVTGGDTIIGGSGTRVYQASITGTGTISCTVTVQGTNEPSHAASSQWIDINAFSLTGTTNDSQEHASVIPWNAVRVVTSSMTGTGATVNVNVSY